MGTLTTRIRRYLSWVSGHGWAVQDFQTRYESGSADSWSYEKDPEHQSRLNNILDFIPLHVPGTTLEFGCAEGFISRQLSRRCDRLLACDFVPEAIKNAEKKCKDCTNIRFLVADVREPLEVDDISLCILSDVLYYLTPVEIRRAAQLVSKYMRNNGNIVFSNEWKTSYRRLTPPDKIMQILQSTAGWHCEESRKVKNPGSGDLWLAKFQILR